MRIARLVLGALIVVVVLWVIVGEQMSGASANAVVNARLSTLRAPIAGRVDLPDRELGAAVTRGEIVGAISDPLVDDVRVNDLEMERVFAETEVARIEDLLGDTRQTARALARRSDRASGRRVAELELRLGHARDRRDLLRADATPEGAAAALRDSAAALELSRAREAVDVLENALAAARDGTFIDGAGDAAENAARRRMELGAAIDGLEVDLHAARARLEAIRNRLVDARISVNRLAETQIAATADGRLWEVLAADGERIQRGEPVMRIVDCTSLIVTLSVTEGVYNRLRVGDAARFRLSGSGEIYDGTVARLAGGGAAALYRNLAVSPSPQHLERFDVALAVPALETGPDLSCPVGRTGRAFFEGRPLDWMRSLF